MPGGVGFMVERYGRTAETFSGKNKGTSEGDFRRSKRAGDYPPWKGRTLRPRRTTILLHIRGREVASCGLVIHGAGGQVPVESCSFY